MENGSKIMMIMMMIMMITNNFYEYSLPVILLYYGLYMFFVHLILSKISF